MYLIKKLKKRNNKKEKRIYYSISNEYLLKNDLNRIYNNHIDNKDYINLYQLLLTIRKTLLILLNDQEQIENNIDKKIINKFGKNSYIVIYEVKNNRVELGFNNNYKNINTKKLIIEKENNTFVIKKDETNNAEYILNIIKEDINNLLKLDNTFDYFHKQYKNHIRCINSSLVVDINLYSINIYIGCDKNLLNIKYSTQEDRFNINGNEEMINIIKNKELELLNKIYISLKDCPEYFKNEIYNQQKTKYKIKRYSK